MFSKNYFYNSIGIRFFLKILALKKIVNLPINVNYIIKEDFLPFAYNGRAHSYMTNAQFN